MVTGALWISVALPLSRLLLTQGPPSPAEGGGLRASALSVCNSNQGVLILAYFSRKNMGRISSYKQYSSHILAYLAKTRSSLSQTGHTTEKDHAPCAS
ncbi:hypothetical protein F1D61_29405 [Methylobacterium aquaticum]|nr:hypothetical protein F1D61_29405 [Methylobacterium aquaticum]